jgi:hypothetical protein
MTITVTTRDRYDFSGVVEEAHPDDKEFKESCLTAL